MANQEKNPGWITIQIDDPIIAKDFNYFAETSFKKILFKEDRICFKYKDKTIVSIIQNDWLKRKTKFMMLILIPLLPKEIVIVGSYFLPGRRMNTALKKAAKNKVKIKLILAGISDVTLSRRATHHIYATLLDNNIELYEWDKTVLHGKAAVVDGNWTTIGSTNNLSSYGSLEMNVEIKSTAFASSYLNTSTR
jgi:cardiolipin synthase